MTIVFSAFLFSSLLFVGVSIPLIMRRIPPNVWYGFRTPATLSNTDIWYDANAYAAKRMLVTGIATAIATLAGLAIPGLNLSGYTTLVMTILFGGLLVTAVQSFLFVHRLKAYYHEHPNGE